MPARTNQWPPKDYRRLYGSLPFGKLRIGISERSCETAPLPSEVVNLPFPFAMASRQLFKPATSIGDPPAGYRQGQGKDQSPDERQSEIHQRAGAEK